MTRCATATSLLILVCATACMDESRVNTDCRWSDSPPRQLDLTRADDRDHLRVDVKVAGELGVRKADVRYRGVASLNAPIRTACINALYDSIALRHGVSLTQIRAAQGDRIWWVDAMTVFVPMAVLVALGMGWVVRRICTSFEPEDRVIVTLAIVALVPVVALVGAGIAQFWGMTVESMLLRNGHVSFRAFQVPAIAHERLTFLGALAVSGVTAFVRRRVTPLTGPRERFARRRSSAIRTMS